MGRRIEVADPLQLLCELPDGWAQTAVTSPPPAGSREETLAVFEQLWRVLRDDATLWLTEAPCARSLVWRLCEHGWQRQVAPARLTAMARRASTPARLTLLTKRRQGYYLDTPAVARPRPPRPRCGSASRCDRGAGAADRSLDRLLRACVQAGSSALACGVCGAPYQQARPGGRRRASCAHHDPHGRCLVLDPFYRPEDLPADPLVWSARSFLGITDRARLGAGR